MPSHRHSALYRHRCYCTRRRRVERYDEHDGNSSFWEAITSPCGSSAQLFQHAGEDGGANESSVPLSIRGGGGASAGGAMAAGCGINGGWYGHLGEFSKQIQI